VPVDLAFGAGAARRGRRLCPSGDVGEEHEGAGRRTAQHHRYVFHRKESAVPGEFRHHARGLDVRPGVFGFLFYYERIIFTEEEFLRKKFGKAFLDWAQRTPVFYPDFKRWQRPDLPFSFKTVLRREYSTFFGIIASFTFIDIAADLATERKLEIKPFWVVLFVGGLVVYLTLMAYKKKTKRLNVAGR